MKKTALLFVLMLLSSSLFAQLPAHLEDKMTYPVFDFNPWVGVVKSKAKALKRDKDLEYKVAIDLVESAYDSTKVMRQITEIARTYNLNVANGVPKRKMEMAVVIHGPAIYNFLNDEAYNERFGTSNPNSEAIKILKKEGIEFYICAQILAFRQVPEENILKDIDLTLSAKTALITLDQMGYTYMKLREK